MARPSVNNVGMTTNSPSQRRSRRVDITKNTARTPHAELMENSYMLPQGTRPAHKPRSTRATVNSPSESHVKDIPTLASLRPGSTVPADSDRSRTATPPLAAPTRTASARAATAAVDRRRPLAKEAAKRTIAMVKVTMVA